MQRNKNSSQTIVTPLRQQISKAAQNTSCKTTRLKIQTLKFQFTYNNFLCNIKPFKSIYLSFNRFTSIASFKKRLYCIGLSMYSFVRPINVTSAFFSTIVSISSLSLPERYIRRLRGTEIFKYIFRLFFIGDEATYFMYAQSAQTATEDRYAVKTRTCSHSGMLYMETGRDRP